MRTLQVRFALVLVLSCVVACGRSQKDAPSRVEAGDRYLAAGQTREAIIEYRNAVTADPRLGTARTKLAVAYEKVGDGGNALGEYVRAADLLPKEIGLQLTAGKYLLAAGRVQEALSRADAALALDPRNVEGHILRGNALGGLNELANALNEMEEALRLEPSRGATYTQLGLVEAARGKQESAQAAFVRAIELAPTDVGAHLALANFYWSTHRLVEAEKALQDALALDPNNEGTNRALAVFALSGGRAGEAERYLARIADLSKSPSSIFTLAEYYIATRNSQRAVEMLTPLAADPRISGAKQRLARAYAAAAQNDKAHALIDELLKANPRDASTLLLKGQMLLDEGKRDEALAVVRSAVDAEPTLIAAQYTLGKVYAARGDKAGAAEAFREVLTQNPGATSAQVELATLQLADGGAPASVRTLDAAIANRPDHIEARIAHVRSLLAAKDFDRAEGEIKQLLEAGPNSSAVLVQQGVLAASRNDITGARQSFERALAADRTSVEALAALLALDLNTKNPAAVKARLDRRLEEANPTAGVLLLAGRTYASINDFPAAERVLKQALEVDQTLLPAYEMLAGIYVRQQRLDEARREFDNLARRQSSPSMALTMSGLLLQALGDHAEARKRYEQAVTADARAAVAANNLAWIYAEAGEKLADALRLARSAAEVTPNVPDVLDTLGWVYYKNSLPSLALAPLGRAVEANPKRASYRYHLGLASAKAGDNERGRSELTKALELDRDASWASEARKALASLPPATR